MMKIASLETFASQFVCFVRLTTDTGAVGWGQTSTYNADITATIFHRQVAPWSLGADAFDIDALVARTSTNSRAAIVAGQSPVSIPRCGICAAGSKANP